MTRRTKLLTHKMILYSLMMLFCYVIQVTPSALALGGIKPLLVLPLWPLLFPALSSLSLHW